MAFEGLSSRLQEITRKLKGKARITESDLKEVLREVKVALLEADVNYKIVKDFIKVIEEKSLVLSGPRRPICTFCPAIDPWLS